MQTLTAFFFLHATRRWLDLSRAERAHALDTQLRPLLAAHPSVQLRYFDAEAWSAEVSDVMLWQYTDPVAFFDLVEALRDTPLWGGWFEVRQILHAIEDGYLRAA